MDFLIVPCVRGHTHTHTHTHVGHFPPLARRRLTSFCARASAARRYLENRDFHISARASASTQKRKQLCVCVCVYINVCGYIIAEKKDTYVMYGRRTRVVDDAAARVAAARPVPSSCFHSSAVRNPRHHLNHESLCCRVYLHTESLFAEDIELRVIRPFSLLGERFTSPTPTGRYCVSASAPLSPSELLVGSSSSSLCRRVERERERGKRKKRAKL